MRYRVALLAAVLALSAACSSPITTPVPPDARPVVQVPRGPVLDDAPQDSTSLGGGLGSGSGG